MKWEFEHFYCNYFHVLQTFLKKKTIANSRYDTEIVISQKVYKTYPSF